MSEAPLYLVDDPPVETAADESVDVDVSELAIEERTFTQSELNAIITKRIERERKSAAIQRDEFEAKVRSEYEKAAAERIAALEHVTELAILAASKPAPPVAAPPSFQAKPRLGISNRTNDELRSMTTKDLAAALRDAWINGT